MNQKALKKMKIFKILMVFFAGCIGAQNFTAKLQPVQKDGLTKITTSPELRSALNNNWNNFRILDSKKREVPYVLDDATPATKENKSKILPILAVKKIADSVTSVIVSNQNSLKLDHLRLSIANTNVQKTYSISGSNDQNNWYGLVYNEMVNDLESSTKTQVEKDFRFPLNQYQFLKFDFVDKKSLPIEVLSVAVNSAVENNSTPLIQLKNFQQNIIQNSKEKTTTINLSFDSPQVINGLKFTIREPKFYLRNATIYIDKIRTVKRREESYKMPVTDFQLNSKAQNQFRIGEIFEKTISIVIENEDNQALEISEIQLFQEPVSLIADLRSSEKYTVLIDPKLTKPNYDLSYFERNLQTQLPETSIVNLEKNKSSEKEIVADAFWKTPLFMWISIAIALLVIGYFSMGLLKDLGKNE